MVPQCLFTTFKHTVLRDDVTSIVGLLQIDSNYGSVSSSPKIFKPSNAPNITHEIPPAPLEIYESNVPNYENKNATPTEKHKDGSFRQTVDSIQSDFLKTPPEVQLHQNTESICISIEPPIGSISPVMMTPENHEKVL